MVYSAVVGMVVDVCEAVVGMDSSVVEGMLGVVRDAYPVSDPRRGCVEVAIVALRSGGSYDEVLAPVSYLYGYDPSSGIWSDVSLSDILASLPSSMVDYIVVGEHMVLHNSNMGGGQYEVYEPDMIHYTPYSTVADVVQYLA